MTLTCALAAKAAVQQTAMRSESFIVARSTIRAPFYNSALAVCQGFTAAQGGAKVTALSFSLQRSRCELAIALRDQRTFCSCLDYEAPFGGRRNMHARRVLLPRHSLRLAKMARSARYTFQFLTFTCNA